MSVTVRLKVKKLQWDPRLLLLLLPCRCTTLSLPAVKAVPRAPWWSGGGATIAPRHLRSASPRCRPPFVLVPLSPRSRPTTRWCYGRHTVPPCRRRRHHFPQPGWRPVLGNRCCRRCSSSRGSSGWHWPWQRTAGSLVGGNNTSVPDAPGLPLRHASAPQLLLVARAPTRRSILTGIRE